MTYELNLTGTNQATLTINLPSGLNDVVLKVTNHIGTESIVPTTDYTLVDDTITYVVPSGLYNIEGSFGYKVYATDYESDFININSHICDEINQCYQIEITSGNYSICIKSVKESSSVSDVKVNNVSVVNAQGIAEINIPTEPDYDKIYPIGSVIWLVNITTTPIAMFGLTWQKIPSIYLASGSTTLYVYRRIN